MGDEKQPRLDDRQRVHVRFCQEYVERHNHGAPGHLDYTTIAALAGIIEELRATRPPDRIVVTWDDKGQCWRDVQTGVQVRL